jgi:2-dehydropantoate 2-reductase
LFGQLGNGANPPALLQELLAACEGSGFEAALSDTIEAEIWAKFVRLAVISGMTAVTRCPLGVVVNDPDLAAMTVAALHESFAVANACGVPLDASVIPAIMNANQSIPGEMKSSMLEDLERGRPLELPFLSGTVVRLGAEYGVPTPVHRFITTVLKPFVNGGR